MQKAISFSNITIIYIKGNAYRIHFWYMSKDDAINIMNDGCFIKIFLLYIKMSESAYLTYYHENDKEKL